MIGHQGVALPDVWNEYGKEIALKFKKIPRQSNLCQIIHIYRVSGTSHLVNSGLRRFPSIITMGGITLPAALAHAITVI